MPKPIPDYGTYFKKKCGNDPSLKLSGFEIQQIAYIDEDLYSISQEIKLHRYFFITLDFDQKRLKQLLKLSDNKKLVSQIEKIFLTPFSEIKAVDFMNSTILTGFSAHPGLPESNKKESYIPFIVDEFFPSKNESTAFTYKIIPNKITHVMMNKNTPVGFAVEDKRKKSKDKNILNACVCYPDSPEYCCEFGAVYLFNSYEEAMNSVSFQLLGETCYAKGISELDPETIRDARYLWVNYESDFRDGFRYRNIKL